jgi:hypothetical protein
MKISPFRQNQQKIYFAKNSTSKKVLAQILSKTIENCPQKSVASA